MNTMPDQDYELEDLEPSFERFSRRRESPMPVRRSGSAIRGAQRSRRRSSRPSYLGGGKHYRRIRKPCRVKLPA